MSHISIERKHNLGREAARAKAQVLVEKLVSRYDVTAQWQGDTVEVRRSGANGQIIIDDDTIRVDLTLGMMMSMMSGTIESEIGRVLDKALAA
jgi:putative polyhydroxyalkanoate system protein